MKRRVMTITIGWLMTILAGSSLLYQILWGRLLTRPILLFGFHLLQPRHTGEPLKTFWRTLNAYPSLVFSTKILVPVAKALHLTATWGKEI